MTPSLARVPAVDSLSRRTDQDFGCNVTREQQRFSGPRSDFSHLGHYKN